MKDKIEPVQVKFKCSLCKGTYIWKTGDDECCLICHGASRYQTALRVMDAEEEDKDLR